MLRHGKRERRGLQPFLVSGQLKPDDALPTVRELRSAMSGEFLGSVLFLVFRARSANCRYSAWGINPGSAGGGGANGRTSCAVKPAPTAVSVPYRIGHSPPGR